MLLIPIPPNKISGVVAFRFAFRNAGIGQIINNVTVKETS